MIKAKQYTVSTSITYLHVLARNACSSQGLLRIGHNYFPCLLGRSGKSFLKHEGDGASPRGKWRLEQLHIRADRMRQFSSKLKTRVLSQKDAWCDAPAHGQYNRHVVLPFKASHERLWRSDHAYDLVATTTHNQRPRVKYHGSAIFLHVINSNATATEGCIALSEKHLRQVLRRCGACTFLMI